MSGVNRMINGKIAQSKSKGSAFKSELGKVFSPSAIAACPACGSKLNKKK